MEASKAILISCLLVVAASAVASEIREGIYIDRSEREPARNAYLAVFEIFEDEFFVLYSDPFLEQHYASVGRVHEPNVLRVDLPNAQWFVEYRPNGTIWHNEHNRIDYHAREFRLVVGDVDAWHYTETQAGVDPDRFREYIRAQNNDAGDLEKP